MKKFNKWWNENNKLPFNSDTYNLCKKLFQEKEEFIDEIGWENIELEVECSKLLRENKKLKLEKLKSDKRLFEFYSKYGDCGDDYYNDIDEINKQIDLLENELRNLLCSPLHFNCSTIINTIES